MANEIILNAFGILGIISSFGIYACPMLTMHKILLKRSVQQFSPDPYLGTAINCMFWILYALPVVHRGSILVLIGNSIGLGLESVYLIMFLLYAKSNQQRIYIISIFIVELAVIGLVGGLVIGLVHTDEERSRIIGILCIIFNLAMSGSPLTIARQVIQTKSVEYMPFFLSLTNTLSGVFWLTYATIRLDLNILIPNIIGAGLGVLQLILYALYYKPSPKDTSVVSVETV
ncbi:hypothetical protein DCAR_0312928 [Daucus carota subsp. sativus]|uniref:Bidirectional sugar transporter SWEET n=1 Tax=Daucus carota subsp. sativus TaxID=79200 RepID=A0AAF0WPZ9_DAUCS|nr:PREDICTED: bidirectional sugar transporter SWEET6a-like [Daucus carota subsp. sativus]WOG93642.1 hypothetical protein DCAR_0312928 [Daucus carota subsp. sativus]